MTSFVHNVGDAQVDGTFSLTWTIVTTASVSNFSRVVICIRGDNQIDSITGGGVTWTKDAERQNSGSNGSWVSIWSGFCPSGLSSGTNLTVVDHTGGSVFSHRRWSAIEMAGGSSVAPVSTQAATGVGSSQAPASAATVDSAVPGDFVVGAIAWPANSVTGDWAAGSGYTKDHAAGTNLSSIWDEWDVIGSSGPVVGDATTTLVARNWAAAVVIYSQAGSVTGGADLRGEGSLTADGAVTPSGGARLRGSGSLTASGADSGVTPVVTVTVVGTDISVTWVGPVTVADIVDAINADFDASALVTASLPSGDGSDAAIAEATTPLEGGVSAGDFEVTDDNLYSTTPSLGMVVQTLPNGVPLDTDITYYVRMVARDIDGSADPGPTESTTVTGSTGGGSGGGSGDFIAVGDAAGGDVIGSFFPDLFLADDTVDTEEIVDLAVTNAKLAGGIAYSKLSLTGAILNADLAGGIAYSKLSLTGAILNADLAGSIAYSKLVLTGAILNADLAGSIAYSKLTLTGSIVNTDIDAAAAIAYSKLNLTGAILNADLAGSIAYSKLALTGSIVNADVNAAAAIAYSKLALTGSIVNADVNAAAAIAYSKLALTGSIVNADVNASAAIAYTKLNLSASIVNADVASGAAIAYSKLNLTGAILNADLAGSIAYSKLTLTNSIVNADVAAGAAIAYSKLALTGSIVNADVNAAAAIAYTKLNLAASIVNADVASGAAIAYSKLNLVGSIQLTDLAFAITTSLAIHSVAFDRLTQGQHDNIVPNPGWEQDSTAMDWTLTSAVVAATSPRSGLKSLVVSAVAKQYLTLQACGATDQFYAEAWVRSSGAVDFGALAYWDEGIPLDPTSGATDTSPLNYWNRGMPLASGGGAATVRIAISWRDSADAEISQTSGTTTQMSSAYALISVSGTAPANTASMRVVLETVALPTGVSALFDDLYARRKIRAAQIESSTITSDLILNGTITGDDIAAASINGLTNIITGSVVGANLAAGTVTYDKLTLAASIVNADVSASAAIAYSKLALTASIVNADVSAGAAIAYSKLNLAGSIANTDMVASMLGVATSRQIWNALATLGTLGAAAFLTFAETVDMTPAVTGATGANDIVTSNQRLAGVAFMVDKARTATGVSIQVQTVGVTPNAGWNGAALFSMNSSGDWVWLKSTNSTTQPTFYTSLGRANLAFTATVALVPGTVYFVAICTSAWTTRPSVYGVLNAAINNNQSTFFRSGGLGGVTAAPAADIVAASLGPFTNVPWIGIY